MELHEWIDDVARDAGVGGAVVVSTVILHEWRYLAYSLYLQGEALDGMVRNDDDKFQRYHRESLRASNIHYDQHGTVGFISEDTPTIRE